MTFQGVISALDIAPIDGSSACELNLFNWEDVEPTSGLPRFDLSPEVVAVETIDCPDPGTSVPLDVDLFVASPYVDLVRVGLFLIVDTPDGNRRVQGGRKPGLCRRRDHGDRRRLPGHGISHRWW